LHYYGENQDRATSQKDTEQNNVSKQFIEDVSKGMLESDGEDYSVRMQQQGARQQSLRPKSKII